MARLKTHYDKVVRPKLKQEFSYKNDLQVPRIEKIVINMGVGDAVADSKKIQAAVSELTLIAGQKPVTTKARKSIATYKLREGMSIGTKVTLRRERMYEFLDRLVNIVLPRLRDFHGVSNKAFDRQGNYSFGFVDQSVFPELTFEETTTAHGLQVVFTIKAQKPEDARALLMKFGMPFEKENK